MLKPASAGVSSVRFAPSAWKMARVAARMATMPMAIAHPFNLFKRDNAKSRRPMAMTRMARTTGPASGRPSIETVGT
ncbi:hypothetical protein D3C74_481230 [compost metagenome]